MKKIYKVWLNVTERWTMKVEAIDEDEAMMLAEDNFDQNVAEYVKKYCVKADDVVEENWLTASMEKE